MGINTRPMVNSALKLDYRTYSVSYFKTYDFVSPYKERHVLDQESVDSCGFFERNYSPQKLLDLSKEYLFNLSKEDNSKKQDNENNEDIDEIDKIVLITGIHADDFKGEFSKFKTKIRGNINTKDLDDKFRFYQKTKNKFDVPLTFKLSDVDELRDILKQYNNNQFILKPLKGNGGLGIFLIDYDSLNELNNSNKSLENISFDDYILQEYVDGTSISSSVLGTNDDCVNLFNSRLVTENDLGNDNFAYSGNIVPLDANSFNCFNESFKGLGIDSKQLNKEMKEISEDLIRQFRLIGSNGVDFILDRKNNLKVIEINPRLQGTYELCEEIMDLNLLDAHIKACEGELVEVPKLNGRYGIKKIIYSSKQVKIGNLSLSNVYDVPYEGVKIEANQPIVTLIDSNKDLKTAIGNINTAEELVYKNIY